MYTDNPLFPFFAQGYRCGFLDGRRRVGVYIYGEESIESFEIAKSHETSMGNPDPNNIGAWQTGYEYGYRRGASGESVPSHIESARLPER